MSGIARQLVRLAERLGGSATSRAAHARQILIVMYHGVVDGHRDWSHWCQLPAQEFRWQIQYLATHYEVLPLSDIIDRLTSGLPLPRNCAAITFDDGLRNNFQVAWPILRELNVPATMYVVTGCVGTDKLLWQDRLFVEMQAFESQELHLASHATGHFRWNTAVERDAAFESLLGTLKQLPVEQKDLALAEVCRQTSAAGLQNPARRDFQLMTWEDAAEMQASGLIEIGPHTVTHELLSRLYDERVEQEIAVSCATVRSQLPASSPTFAFPNGTREDFDARVFSALHQSGMSAAVTTVSGLNRRTQPLFELKRVGIGSDMDRSQFRAEVSGLMDCLRQLKRTPDSQPRLEQQTGDVVSPVESHKPVPASSC